MPYLSRAAGLLALAGTPVVACGARSWLPSDGPPDADVGTQADAAPFDDASCRTSDVPLVPDVPNLYFVLDVSRSMLDNGKWANVRSVVVGLVQDLGANASFGVTVFPAPGANQCAAGIEVMPLQRGDTAGRTATVLLGATALTPNGGTPTAATFRALVPKFKDLPGSTYVILATDGGPNCDPNVPLCDVDHCTPNIDLYTDPRTGVQQCSPAGANCCTTNRSGCLDSDATAKAVSDLLAVGVQTYVMGIPGSAPYGPVLDALAVAGGTARATEPLYYRVDSADAVALGAAFQQIAADAMRSCVLRLAHPAADQNKVNVSIDGNIFPSDGPNGWALHGQAITLVGSACGAVRAGAVAPIVKVLEGCPTVR